MSTLKRLLKHSKLALDNRYLILNTMYARLNTAELVQRFKRWRASHRHTHKPSHSRTIHPTCQLSLCDYGLKANMHIQIFKIVQICPDMCIISACRYTYIHTHTHIYIYRPIPYTECLMYKPLTVYHDGTRGEKEWGREKLTYKRRIMTVTSTWRTIYGC